MDMGIRGRFAIVCAASKGLGRACALALGQEGVNLVINARNPSPLEATAEEIRLTTGVDVTAVAADITTAAGRDAVLSACPDPDILINNAGGPPPGDFRGVERQAWIQAVDANMLTPIFLIRAIVDGMVARGFGRIVNITTSGVKNPAAFPALGVSIAVRSDRLRRRAVTPGRTPQRDDQWPPAGSLRNRATAGQPRLRCHPGRSHGRR
jgi:3-oxoacyl-[acyl-carrier protein] reductase